MDAYPAIGERSICHPSRCTLLPALNLAGTRVLFSLYVHIAPGPILYEFANAACWLGNWRGCPGPHDRRSGSSLRQEQEEATPCHWADTAIH
jgi:hypothetical protein